LKGRFTSLRCSLLRRAAGETKPYSQALANLARETNSRGRVMKTLASVLLLLAGISQAYAQRPPNIVPHGWRQEAADPETKTRRFVSPDGRAWLETKQTPADRDALERDMDDVAYRPEEKITYQKRGRTWIAVSGYWGDQIFYRKSNLACGGTRWHHVEFGYPRELKKHMDAAVTRMAHGMTEYSNDCDSRASR